MRFVTKQIHFPGDAKIVKRNFETKTKQHQMNQMSRMFVANFTSVRILWIVMFHLSLQVLGANLLWDEAGLRQLFLVN